MAFAIWLCGCKTVEKTESKFLLKSAKIQGIQEKSISAEERKVLAEFESHPLFRKLFEGEDPLFVSPEEYKNLSFTVIPVFSLCDSLLKDSGPVNVPDIYKLNRDMLFFLGKTGDAIVFYMKARFDKNNKWKYTIPALKSECARWVQKFIQKKQTADNQEVFFLDNYSVIHPAWYRNGELFSNMFHLQGREMDEIAIFKLAVYNKERIERAKHTENNQVPD